MSYIVSITPSYVMQIMQDYAGFKIICMAVMLCKTKA